MSNSLAIIIYMVVALSTALLVTVLYLAGPYAAMVGFFTGGVTGAFVTTWRYYYGR